jgi:hypothetical protein
MHDEIGECINNMVDEMSSMSHFVRSTKNRQFEDAETADMANAATQHYINLKKTLRHLANKKYYHEFCEDWDRWEQAANPLEEIDVAALRERFVKKIYDDRFDNALPAVYKAYKKYRAESAEQLSSELEEWADTVAESTWAKPDTDDKVHALQELMKTPLMAGIDGIDATTSLKPLIGDDDLNTQIHRYAQDQGPDADCRPLVKTWVQNNMPELGQQLEVGPNNGSDATTNTVLPTSPQQAHPNDYGADTTDDPITDPNVKLREHDSLTFLRTLAGLAK